LINEASMNLKIRLSPRFSIDKAHEIQRTLSERLIREDQLPNTINYVAGVDVAYIGPFSIGAVIVSDFNSGLLIERKIASQRTRFPYIPTLLSFREIPPVTSAIKKLKTWPDIFLVDGQGIAHPYRLGFASHLGLILNVPAIGIAKSLLCGKVEASKDDGWNPIIHEGEVVGAAVITKLGYKPVYVSIGHKISLETAVRIVIRCIKNHRIPEPLRQAHIVANEEKRRIREYLQ